MKHVYAQISNIGVKALFYLPLVMFSDKRGWEITMKDFFTK